MYELLDSGEGKKLEKFSDIILERPSQIALWKKREPKLWERAHGLFTREEKKGWKGKIPKEWECEIEGLNMRLKPTDFGHIGLFPEHLSLYRSIEHLAEKGDRLLNLFAYTGSATLFFAKRGMEVVHLDASKPSIEWAKENAAINDLQKAPIRYILDDALRFVQREVKREKEYELIILDPPSFGRGAKNEVFKIERDLLPLLEGCKRLLSKNAKGILLSCHTPGITPLVLEQLLEQVMKRGVLSREILIPSKKGFFLPTGSYALWDNNG